MCVCVCVCVCVASLQSSENHQSTDDLDEEENHATEETHAPHSEVPAGEEDSPSPPQSRVPAGEECSPSPQRASSVEERTERPAG